MNKSLSALVLSLAFVPPAFANIDIQFDYSYDTGSFFTSNAGSKSALESAASIFESRFSDNLSAIASSGQNDFNSIFFNPSDPFGSNVTLNSQSFAADVIRIYVGGANLGSSTLGLGGPGGFGCSGVGSFCTDADRRGQGATSGANPVDFAPWGGAISFDKASTNWHFGSTTSGLDAGEFDFYSVAVHELAHVLGFGTADSFNALVSGTNFVGSSTGTVELDGDQAHWASGTFSTFNGLSQEAAMDPSIASGTRKYFTDLDFAAMQDIGWQVTPVPEARSWVMMLAGLGMIASLARLRSRTI
ncbi:MAG: hypothetical protein Q8K52_11780 [Thiobacillus sp.]|nr:hypothetical protein [Thiobacillus sp.]